MICEYGMSDKLGPLSYGQHNHQPFLGRDLFEQKDYSEETSKEIDIEVRRLVTQAYERAREILTGRREMLDKLAQTLVEKEVLDIDETKQLLGLTEIKKDLGMTAQFPASHPSAKSDTPERKQS